VGASTGTLALRPVRYEDEGWYTLEGRAGADSVSSEAVFLRVLPTGAGAAGVAKPWIVRGPQGRVVQAGSPLELSVEAVCGPALSLTYQWNRNGVALVGQTDRVLRIDAAQVEHQGAYTVEVNSGAGAVLSPPAWVTVLASAVSPTLVFQDQPMGGLLWAGKVRVLEPLLNVPAASYQWYRNGLAIPGATGPFWGVRAVRGTDIYQVWAADGGGKGVMSEAVPIQYRDFSAWKGSFQGVLLDGDDRVGGRATVSISALGSVSASVVWESAFFRLTGRLQDNRMEAKIPRFAGAEGVFRVECDPETGALALQLRRSTQIVGSSATCRRAVSRMTQSRWTDFSPQRAYWLESEGNSASGALSGTQGTLGVASLRRQSAGNFVGSGLLADGGVWTASALALEDDSAVFFARVSRPSSRPAGWLGGTFVLGTAPLGEPRFDWCQPAGGTGDFAAGFRAQLRAVASNYSAKSFPHVLLDGSSQDFDIRAEISPSYPESFPVRWSASGGGFLPQGLSFWALSGLQLRVDLGTGFIRGVGVDSASRARLEWTGLLDSSGERTPFGAKGFVRKGKGIVSFEMMPGTGP
jgi:hypothetical protein